jgi:hypothetical protein
VTRIAQQYRLRLSTAAVFPKGDADPNTVDTWDRVPGSVMLGAFATRWLERYPSAEPSRDPVFRRLFLTGETRFLHALSEGPDHGSGRSYRQPLLPCPRSLYSEKQDDSRLHDLAADPSEPADPGLDLRRADLGYVRFGEPLQHRRPDTELRLHHQRDRDRGRPVEHSGAIFAYLSLRAGERFIGEIHASGEDLELLQELLGHDPLRLGRSRGAEYGGNASIEWLARSAEEALQPRSEEGAPHLVVTLLSEYAGRKGGEALAEAFFEDLYAELGHRPELSRQFLERRPLVGYVAAWRLPRPTHEVLAAGSVFVFEEAAAEPRPRVVWLGERQAEGLGRVAIGWHGGVRELRAEPFAPAKATAPSIADGALTRAMLQQWVLQELPVPVPDGRSLPSASALGAYRAGETLSHDAQRAIGRCRVRLGDARVGLKELSWRDPLSYLADRARPEWLRGVALSEDQEKEICHRLVDGALDALRREAARRDR